MSSLSSTRKSPGRSDASALPSQQSIVASKASGFDERPRHQPSSTWPREHLTSVFLTALVPTRDLSPALGIVADSLFEPMHPLDLPELARKAAFLVAAASSRRISKIQALFMKEEHPRFSQRGCFPSFLEPDSSQRTRLLSLLLSRSFIRIYARLTSLQTTASSV